jgi:hypothetical protein
MQHHQPLKSVGDKIPAVDGVMGRMLLTPAHITPKQGQHMLVVSLSNTTIMRK